MPQGRTSAICGKVAADSGGNCMDQEKLEVRWGDKNKGRQQLLATRILCDRLKVVLMLRSKSIFANKTN